MADLHKLTVQEAMNASGSGGQWSVESAVTHAGTAEGDTRHVDVSTAGQIGIYSAGEIYFKFSKDVGVDVETDDGFILKGFKIVEGIEGFFVGFPSQKGSDDEYHDTVWADRDVKELVNQLAIKDYGQEIMSPTPMLVPLATVICVSPTATAESETVVTPSVS